MSAYLLACIDIKKSPPVVTHVGIYSDCERSITTYNGEKYARLAEAEGPFHVASEDLLDMVAMPHFAWLHRYFKSELRLRRMRKARIEKFERHRVEREEAQGSVQQGDLVPLHGPRPRK